MKREDFLNDSFVTVVFFVKFMKDHRSSFENCKYGKI